MSGKTGDDRWSIPESLKEQVRQQVARVKVSPAFRGSKRCVDLLEFVTENTLLGHPERLKERVLGVEVFGREPGYDTSQDPVVRYTAGDIRKRLAQYYQNSGHEREFRIQLPPGSYILEFQQSPGPPADAVPAVPERPKNRRPAVAAAVTAAVLLSVLLVWWRPWAGNSVLDRFWAPFRNDPGAVLMSIGEPKVFTVPEHLYPDFMAQAETYHKAGLPVPNSILPPSGLFPVWDRYIPLGDAACMARLAVQLQQLGKAYRIRGSPATSLADLRDGPDILIGALTNQWSLRMTEGLRFSFVVDNVGHNSTIRDRLHPEKDDWKVGKDFWPDPKNWTDYGLITRIRHSPTGRVMLVAAGVNRHATSAAGEILTSTGYLEEALRTAPRGWEDKNIQIVFETSVVEGNAGPPQILAVHVW